MKKIILLCVIGMLILTGCHNSTATNWVNEATATPSVTVTPYATSTQKSTPTLIPSQEPDFESSDNIVEYINGYKRFNMTRTEFIQRYNKIVDDIVAVHHIPIILENEFSYAGEITDAEKTVGISNKYSYDLTFYTEDNYNMGHTREISIFVDKDDKIISVHTGHRKDRLSSDAMDDFLVFGSHMYLALLKTKTFDDYKEELQQFISSGPTVYYDKQWMWGIRDIGEGTATSPAVTTISILLN